MRHFAVISTLLAVTNCSLLGQNAATPLRAEIAPLAGGAELITYFQEVPGDAGEMPLLAVLKDTLGDADPGNDRLRQVWVFTYRPTPLWRGAAGAVPFLYTRAPLPDGNPGLPPPVLDMGDPSRGLWKRVAAQAVQSGFLDGVGWTVRLATRSYGFNLGEYRRMHVWQALDVLASSGTTGNRGLTAEEMRMIQGRLELSDRTLGGLVADEYLDRAYEKARARRLMARQSNWDLLRQRAEENGLYFQPLSLAGLRSAWAMLWVAASDLVASRPFDSKFLGIANPFGDASLPGRIPYNETWWLDEFGARARPGQDGARPVRMIPLALYALDQPRAPLLLVDMRREGAPRRTEMSKRLVTDVTTGVLGFTGVGNWWYMAAKTGYTFVRSRHGSPLDRSARLRAYVQVQHALAADRSLTPALRQELARRVDALNVNPLERNWARELKVARLQYQAFLEYARAAQGLARQLEKNRTEEAYRAAHGPGQRALLGLASVASLGIYRHREKLDQPELTQLEERRRDAWLKRQAAFLPPEPSSASTAAGSTFVGGEPAQ